MSLRRCPALSVCVCLCIAAPALAGPDWIEGGTVGGPDAGSTLGGAQQTRGSGPLRSISGTLSLGSSGFDGGGSAAPPAPPDFEDMYLINIEAPTTFFFQVTSATFDAQLWLFRIEEGTMAFGLLGNNDTPSSTAPRLMQLATDGSGAGVSDPGLYALAISGLGRVPVSESGLIFNLTSPTEISGPDGPGGNHPHNGWVGQGAVGPYVIEMEGVTWSDVPAPGAASLMVVGGGLLGARRRRR